VNLEVALLRAPLIVFYRTSPLNYLIARFVVKLRRVSPVNILLDEEAVPEYIQRIPVAEAVRVAVEILGRGPAAKRQAVAAERLTRIVGTPGVTRQVAGWILCQAGTAGKRDCSQGGAC